MSSVVILLRQHRKCEWYLVGPKGNTLSPIFRGDQERALEWSKTFVSSWYNWIVQLETDKDKEDEEKNRMSGETF